jgi:hypothetical protein
MQEAAATNEHYSQPPMHQLEMINERRAGLHTSNAVHRRKISSAHPSNNNSVTKSQRVNNVSAANKQAAAAALGSQSS